MHPPFFSRCAEFSFIDEATLVTSPYPASNNALGPFWLHPLLIGTFLIVTTSIVYNVKSQCIFQYVTNKRKQKKEKSNKKVYYSDWNDLIFIIFFSLFEFDFCDFSKSLARAQIGCSQLLFLFLILQVYFLLWLSSLYDYCMTRLCSCRTSPPSFSSCWLYTRRPPTHFPRL